MRMYSSKIILQSTKQLFHLLEIRFLGYPGNVFPVNVIFVDYVVFCLLIRVFSAQAQSTTLLVSWGTLENVFGVNPKVVDCFFVDFSVLF